MKIGHDQAIRLIELSKKYLGKNVERFNEQEKKQFMNKLLENLKGDQKFMYDEVYDFLVYYDLVNGISRHKNFAKYITKRYSPTSNRAVLDIGAGRLCKLSAALSKHGFNMYAMDPNIRILEHEAKGINIHISKDLFLCDEFAKNNKGTDISSFDLLVGLEPCIATEHIIRQALKYDKPFEVVLCYEAHDALSGQKFRTVDEWFEHLLKISKEIEIFKYNQDYIARLSNKQPILENPQYISKLSNPPTDSRSNIYLPYEDEELGR